MTTTTTTTSHTYYHGRKSRIGMDAQSAQAFRWVFARLAAGQDLVAGEHSVTIRHEDRCARCGRTLTVPASIDSGFGPQCAEKVGVEWRERIKDGEFIPLAFLLGGRAVFTASSTRGGRFTFKVTRAKARPGDTVPIPRWFVSVLTGEDNENDFTYLGTIVGTV